MSTLGDVEVISQPRLTLLHNVPAVIQVGTTQAYVDSIQIETTQTGTITSISTSQVQSGVTLRLMGSIMNDDIYLSVTPSVTSIDSIRSVTSGSSTIEAPSTTTKSLSTMVKVKDGETAIIGGLITSTLQNFRNSVP
ncbi:MAG: hypothetical protein IIA67_01415, partial [Planctomycetes bacterium]|nr:hypothetical protein [Planctomycetota bacterium]